MKQLIKIPTLLIIITNYSCKSDYSVVSKGIKANLVLASAIDNETGKMIGKGKSFVIMNNGWVEASLDLSTYFEDDEEDLLIHLDWVDEMGNSFYKKQHLFKRGSSKVNTAISISPELRRAGNYKLDVYVFRELVASKKFQLLPVFKTEKEITETIKIETRANKATLKHKADKPSIHLMDDKWIKASVSFKNKPKVDVKKLLYQLNWIDSKGEVFYKKKYSIAAKKKKSKIDCSIEVAPNKKKAGDYKIQLLLFGKLITEKKFVLTPVLDVSKLKTSVTLLESIPNGKENGFNFTIADNNKVNAIFGIDNCLIFGEKEALNFKISWVGANGKKFYSKRFNFTPKTDKKTIKSAISISPKKRKSGNYKVQLYLFNQLISESDFSLK